MEWTINGLGNLFQENQIKKSQTPKAIVKMPQVNKKTSSGKAF